MKAHHLSPAEAGARLAAVAPPITKEQAEAAARILYSVAVEQAREQQSRVDVAVVEVDPDVATPQVPRLLYAKPEAAQQLSVSVRVLDRLIADGQIETVLLGRRRLVPREALEDYVDRLRGST